MYPSVSHSSCPFGALPLQQLSLVEYKALMQSTNQVIEKMKNSIHMNTQAITKLDSQSGKLATHVGDRERGKL